MPKQDSNDEWEFRGFTNPTTTPVPDEFFDVLAPRLTEAELRVTLYIIRRTFGFKKSADNISLRQMVDGIRTKDDRVLDQGTGLSKPAVIRAVRSLVQRKIITATSRQSADKGFEATTYSLNILHPVNEEAPLLTRLTRGGKPSLPALVNEDNLQQTVEQQTVKQEIDPSKIRKAENEKTGYVNQRAEDNGEVGATPTNEKTEQRKRGRPPQTQRDGNEENQRLSKHRNIEEPQQVASAQDREVIHKTPTERVATPGLMRLGDVLHHQHIPQAVPDDEAYAAIRDYIRDMAGKHHDEASLKSSTTRAYHLYQRSGVSLSYFFSVLYDADKEAGRRSGSIKKRTADGFTNRMPYIFAYMEDKLGLRDKPH